MRSTDTVIGLGLLALGVIYGAVIVSLGWLLFVAVSVTCRLSEVWPC